MLCSEQRCIQYVHVRLHISKQCLSLLQVPGGMLLCKVCSAPLQAQPGAIRCHAKCHLTELGLCTVCGASPSSGTAGLTHALSHVGVQLFTCDMCHLQFCSQNKLLQHHRQTASSYTLPHGALMDSSQNLNSELQCAVCQKTLNKDFQVSRIMHSCQSPPISRQTVGDSRVSPTGL